MTDFTVVSYHTSDFECFAGGLKSDCDSLGYPVHIKDIGQDFDDLIKAFDYKISFLREMVLRFGSVLWLDIECRIVNPLPTDWSGPLISSYSMGGHIGLSSGVLMLGESDLEGIDLWLKYAEAYPMYPDDFVLDFLIRSTDLEFSTVPFEFYDRDTKSPIVRGLWQNKHTIIQHPTINRWPNPLKYRQAFNGKVTATRPRAEEIARQRKGIFFRNFGGDVGEIMEVMMTRKGELFVDSDWVFDPVSSRYAPQLFWPQDADNFNSKPVSFELSKKHFYNKPKGRTFRQHAIRSMMLDSEDRRKFASRRKGLRVWKKLDRLNFWSR